MGIPHRRPTRQRGVTLLEALIAFLILTLGMLAVTRMQASLRAHAELARQRSEAVRLADEDIESLRSFATLAAAPGLRAYDDIAPRSWIVAAGGGQASNTRYQLTREVEARGTQSKAIALRVEWADRNGDAQQLLLHTVIARADPSLSASLGMLPSNDPVAGPFGRSIRIPLVAKDLGDGRSAFKPVADGSVALVLDNRSGRVVARCAGVAPTIDTATLTPAALLGCDANTGLLLSGVVRFSALARPDAAHPNEMPLPTDIDVALDGEVALPTRCSTEGRKTVAVTSAGSMHFESVPLAATPASIGATAWADRGERSLAYHCVVYPAAGIGWSGRAMLRPTGWRIGAAAGEQRVCRYSSDLDGSGAIDANIEHPARYAAVSSSLAQQNFLVIDAAQACPAGTSVQIANQPNDVFANLATVPHQP